MKTMTINLKGSDYVITRMNCHDASFIATQFLPVITALQGAVESEAVGSAISRELSKLTKDKYNEIVFSLFELIKKKDKNTSFDIFKNGMFIYEDIKEDPFVYLTLLKESFLLSFKDFLASAVQALVGEGTALNDQLSTQA